MGAVDNLRLFEFECNKLTSILAGTGYGASIESGPDAVTLSTE